MRLGIYAEANGLLTHVQWAFRKGRSTIDPSFIFRVLMETAATLCPTVHNGPICFLIMDIMKAYPSVPWALCWRILERAGVPARMCRTLQQLNESTEYVIRAKSGDSAPYRFQGGLREGCPASCVVFNLYHNLVLLLPMDAIRDNQDMTMKEDEYRPLPVLTPVDPPVLNSSDTASLKVLGYADDTNPVTTLGSMRQRSSKWAVETLGSIRRASSPWQN